MAQVLFPITSRHEMAGETFGTHPPMVIRGALLGRLRENAEYAARFASVFGEDDITLRQLAEAIAAFERQLIFTAAPWDDYAAGDAAALDDAQKRGALLFFGALKQGVACASCHSGDLFTDQDFHNLLTPQVGPGKDNGADGRDDFGRANVSFDYRDQYRFKTPSLRNVALTAPYMHSGAYAGPGVGDMASRRSLARQYPVCAADAAADGAAKPAAALRFRAPGAFGGAAHARRHAAG